MKYTKLDITDSIVTRKDFVDQPRKLFVLPDNLPDFRLPRNQLHLTKNRGGLAKAMRPNKIEGTDAAPIYDVNIVGVPTLSFDANERITPKIIVEAFAGIYRLLNCEEFDELVVPWKGGIPAFGGGIAGKLDANIKKAIINEFARLEKFLNKKIPVEKLPIIYQKAYNEGPLPLPVGKPSFMQNLLSQSYPRLSLMTKGILGIGAFAATAGALVSFGLVASSTIGLSIALVAGALAGIASTYLYSKFLRSFFGEEKQQFKLNGRKGWYISKLESNGAIIETFGIKAPYKTTLPELEKSIAQQLTHQLGKDQKSAEPELKQEVKTFTKYYAKEIVNKTPIFSAEETSIVNSPEYAVEDDIKQYRAKSKGA